MSHDVRAHAAEFYDLDPTTPHDSPFYRERVPSSDSRILELGCGTARVLVPLAACCGYIRGIDSSAAMLERCKKKLALNGVPESKARVELGDITRLDLGQTFDLIIAPFRVLQTLETDAEVDGLFRGIQRHLAPGGSCILNVFKPFFDAARIRTDWCNEHERIYATVPVEGGHVEFCERRRRMDTERLILYPELVFRHYEGGVLKKEVVLNIVMRCYYPIEFEELISEHGFRIVDRWGGYAGERYGDGPELVIQFRTDPY